MPPSTPFSYSPISSKSFKQHPASPSLRVAKVCILSTLHNTLPELFAGNRLSRWKNMEEAFWASEPNMIKNKNILLIDDVITTGASLEACGRAILQVPGTSVSVATAAYTV